MPIKKLVIHLGMPKAGSSSIQYVLFRNPKILERNGFRYLSEWGANNADIFNFLFTNELGVPWYMCAEIKEDRSEVVRKATDALLKVLKEADGKTLILSGEYSPAFTCPKTVDNFKSFLNKHFPGIELQIILFVRNPIEWMISLAKQSLPAYTLNPHVDLYENYNELFKGQVDVLSREFSSSLSLIKFEEAIKDSDGLHGFFLKKIGIPEAELKEFNFFFVNERRCAEVTELLKFIGDKEPYFIGHPKRPNLKRFPIPSPNGSFLLSYSADVSFLGAIKGVKLDFSYESKLALQERFGDTIAWLKERTGIDYTDYEIKEKPIPEMYSEETIDSLIGVFPKLTSTLQKLFLEFFEKKYVYTAQEKFKRLYFEGSVPRRIYEELKKTPGI